MSVDSDFTSSITNAKDEIIAYLREGLGILGMYDKNRTPTIKTILLDGESYQYNLSRDELKDHKYILKKLLTYANDLIKLTKKENGITRDNIISMLSYTPREDWSQLHKSIMEAVNNKKSIDRLRRTGTAKKTNRNRGNIKSKFNRRT